MKKLFCDYLIECKWRNASSSLTKINHTIQSQRDEHGNLLFDNELSNVGHPISYRVFQRHRIDRMRYRECRSHAFLFDFKILYIIHNPKHTASSTTYGERCIDMHTYRGKVADKKFFEFLVFLAFPVATFIDERRSALGIPAMQEEKKNIEEESIFYFVFEYFAIFMVAKEIPTSFASSIQRMFRDVICHCHTVLIGPVFFTQPTRLLAHSTMVCVNLVPVSYCWLWNVSNECGSVGRWLTRIFENDLIRLSWTVGKVTKNNGEEERQRTHVNSQWAKCNRMYRLIELAGIQSNTMSPYRWGFVLPTLARCQRDLVRFHSFESRSPHPTCTERFFFFLFFFRQLHCLLVVAFRSYFHFFRRRTDDADIATPKHSVLLHIELLLAAETIQNVEIGSFGISN